MTTAKEKKDDAQDAQYVELLWPLVPKGDVDGALDWFTGVIALDLPHETWQNLEKEPRDVRERTSKVYWHEVFHSIQLSSLGFMYDWAADLFELIRPVVKRVQAEIAPGDFSGVKKMIQQGPKLLTAAERDAARRHFALLDTPGQSGLTVRAILESHAYFVERRVNYKMEKAFHWTPHLEDAPDPLYRVAFDFLAFAAGYATAFEWFPIVASMSLCTEDPVATFERVSIALAPGKIDREVTGARMETEEMFDFVVDAVPDAVWTSPLVITEKHHPVFTDTAKALHSAIEAGAFTQSDLFARPDLVLGSMNKWGELAIPMIFKRSEKGQIAVQVPPNMEQTAVLVLFTIGAVGRQLTRAEASASQKEGEAAIARLSWLGGGPQAVVTLTPEMFRTGAPGALLDIFDPFEASSPRHKLWGRTVLQVPKEIDPNPDVLLPQVKGARQLMAALRAKLPMFLVYMSVPYGAYEWFGSLGPLTAKGEIVLDDPRTAALIAETRVAIDDTAEQLNQNAWLAKQCLLEPFAELARAACIRT